MELTDCQDYLDLPGAMTLLDRMRALDWIDRGHGLRAVGARQIGFR